MPKHKSSKKAESSGSGSDSDSGPEDRGPIKKPKSDTKPDKKQKASKSSEEDNNSWDLGKNRFVKLTEFKGKWYVNIREFYNADGDLKPTKKGVMLTMEQWQTFKNSIDGIDEAIKKNV